ncbi:Glyoxalase/Bleomycin resistance protein/Dioxygenase superfamily protein [Sphingobium faniae]|nr:Glyoxalase/Bleomycin resistance protein/Dioxygenase superfamily protein [Sphingobium faniae]
MTVATNPTTGAIRQIAYFVSDIVVAARRHHALFGSGPFYIAEHIALARCEHRGRPATLDHSSAYGQWGDIMVEFVQQNNAGPSVFRDIFPDGREGMHHVALMVNNLGDAIQAYNDQGMETAFYAVLESGQAYTMMDATATHGHFIELYEPNAVVTYVYDLVRRAAQDFDGSDPIRYFDLA